MLVKCETRSFRVKGLSFHPKLNWILASLHNGVIQLWDYRIGSLIERYEEHEGPVRGVDFHSSQPIFVSGGDDYKIKVWNYRQRRCIFTLLGHLDYIRTVQFHPEYPWILSCSDDQTVRLWNWQNRSCIAVLAGHNHYVMCAQFHRKQDLLVSACLDQTIRVWDISGLREKSVSSRNVGPLASGGLSYSATNGTIGVQVGGAPSFMMLQGQQHDIFGTSDAVCKFVLQGHDRGINWVALHPTMPLIASGGDDRLVKLWRYDETKWWEVETFRGHSNNVSSLMFHPLKDLLISNSEDRTIRVWDITKRILVHTFRRESDRFWISSGLINSNVIAVGHDSGMVVFKLDRERVASHTFMNQIYYVKDKWITMHQCGTEASATIVTSRRPANAMFSGPRSLMRNPLNPTELNLLVFYKEPEGGSYDLINVKDVATASAAPGSILTRQGTGSDVTFVARNRFAVLEPSGSLAVYNLSNELSKRFEIPFTSDKMFYAGNNRVLLKCDEQVHLYDLTAKKSLAELTCSGGARYAIWSSSFQHVALICKHHVVIADSKLEYLCSVHETIRVKGGAWDPIGAFVYSTLSHIKYLLLNGDQGIMRCLMHPLYILRIENQMLWVVDRETQEVRTETLNCTEYLFKLALHAKQFEQVVLLIKEGRLCGNAVVSYLRKKGFPEVALQFVSDIKTRFNLAIEDGNLEEAKASAIALNDKDCWARFGIEAMRQGDFQTAEMVYQKNKNLNRLSLFYLITGNTEKLKRMLQIAEMQNDLQGRFNNALLLGDADERVRVLAEASQLPLAALTAQVTNNKEFSRILEESEQVQMCDLDSFFAERPPPSDLRPPMPLPTADVPVDGSTGLRATSNWPRFALPGSRFESALAQTLQMTPEAAEALRLRLVAQAAATATGQKVLPEVGLLGGVNEDLFAVLDQGLEGSGMGASINENAWGDLDDDFVDLGGATGKAHPTTMVTSPSVELQESDSSDVKLGDPPEEMWVKGNPSISNLVAAGKYSDALEFLSKRIGLINADPLQPIFESIAIQTYASLPMLPLVPSKRLPILESGNLLSGVHQPVTVISIQSLFDLTKDAHRLVTAGKLEEALALYRGLLCRLTLAEATTAEEESQLNDLLVLIRTYALAMYIESERQKLTDLEGQRSVELVAYLGCCKLQPSHHLLTIRRAMTVAWKAQNFITSATFARKLIQGNFSAVQGAADIIARAKKLLLMSQEKGVDRHLIDFEASESDSLMIDAVALKQILPSQATIKCPFCGVVATRESAGQLCPICQMCELGARVLGLQFRPIAS